jgi:hypothetical protein
MRKVREIGRFKLTNKYAAAWKGMKEWIKIVRGRPVEEVMRQRLIGPWLVVGGVCPRRCCLCPRDSWGHGEL